MEKKFKPSLVGKSFLVEGNPNPFRIEQHEVFQDWFWVIDQYSYSGYRKKMVWGFVDKGQWIIQ